MDPVISLRSLRGVANLDAASLTYGRQVRLAREALAWRDPMSFVRGLSVREKGRLADVIVSTFVPAQRAFDQLDWLAPVKEWPDAWRLTLNRMWITGQAHYNNLLFLAVFWWVNGLSKEQIFDCVDMIGLTRDDWTLHDRLRLGDSIDRWNRGEYSGRLRTYDMAAKKVVVV